MPKPIIRVSFSRSVEMPDGSWEKIAAEVEHEVLEGYNPLDMIEAEETELQERIDSQINERIKRFTSVRKINDSYMEGVIE